MESVYWVFTLRCNDTCDHCYNDSSPQGEAIDTAELLRVVPNLPEAPGRIILSGGEPTVEMEKLAAVCGAIRERYGRELPLWLQSNGDLLDDRRLDRVLAMGIDRIDIVSIDRYHKHQGRHAEALRARFVARGMVDAQVPEAGTGGGEPGAGSPPSPQFAFWGATDDLWLKGNWARGRAIPNKLAKLDPEHNFCNMWSGALGFLDDGSDQQEVHIQLYRLYPCCPGTYYALGDVRSEPVASILDRYRGNRDWQALNRGQPKDLGVWRGLDPEHVRRRIQELGDVCLWCDEYFRRYYDGPQGEPRKREHRTPMDV